ncbi:MAG TPA: hypothetical protein VJW75_05965, partial [Candidatus Eisenbacteria bacterium]|nr:hypothetical protein [Candidatus Eisenbacteria bacterium]
MNFRNVVALRPSTASPSTLPFLLLLPPLLLRLPRATLLALPRSLFLNLLPALLLRLALLRLLPALLRLLPALLRLVSALLSLRPSPLLNLRSLFLTMPR